VHVTREMPANTASSNENRATGRRLCCMTLLLSGAALA
jgi:hypothetical protein